MRINWIDQLGDWNPQLLREIKGRCKPRDLSVTAAISLLGQFFLFRSFQGRLPISRSTQFASDVYSRYCTSIAEYDSPNKCLTDPLGNLLIDWQSWWLDMFVLLSIISVFVLLLTGTHMLISDLAHEGRRDTLNFIRLSPKSSQSILIGKLLGVPILLYFAAALVVPLHLWAGLSAQIPLGLILSFYGLLVASCLFFYSAALLFGLVSSWLGGFQAWLGTGTVSAILWINVYKPITHTPDDWLNLFSPTVILPKLIAATNVKSDYFSINNVTDLAWFYLPLGTSVLGAIALALINYGLWTYWSWQALQRRFHNPGKTTFSKRQSYLFVASFEVMILGFAATKPKYPFSTELSVNFQVLLVFNLLLFLGLIVALTPGRQALQDWARYRRERVSAGKRFGGRSLVRDLVWGEKSPAIVAIALNLVIAAVMLTPWIVLKLQDVDKLPAFLALVIGANLILIYAAIAQLLMFMRTQKQALWVIGTVSAVILLPPMIFSLLALETYTFPGLWLFTPFAWASIEHASVSTIFLAVLGQWSIFTLCALRITRQIKQAGESNSKALFAERPLLKG